MKMVGRKAPVETVLLAMILDQLLPQEADSFAKIFLEESDTKAIKSGNQTFRTGSDFEEARKKILSEVKGE